MDNNINMNKVEEAKQNLENTTINDENYEEVVKTRNSYDNIILAQLENLRMDFEDGKGRYDELMQTENVKSSLDNGVVPVDAFKELTSLMRLYRNIVSWENLKMTYDDILITKMSDYIKMTNQKKLVRDTWTAMNEERKEQNEHFRRALEEKDQFTKDLITSRIENIDESLNGKFRSLQETFYDVEDRLSVEYKKDRKEVFDFMKMLIEKLNLDDEKIKNVLKDAHENDKRIEFDEKSKTLKTSNEIVGQNIKHNPDDFSLDGPIQKNKENNFVVDDEIKEDEEDDDNNEYDFEDNEMLKKTNKTMKQIEEDFNDLEVN